jgi:hypothetical protein
VKNNEQCGQTEENPVSEIIAGLREFLSDLLGAFVPGLFFVATCVALLALLALVFFSEKESTKFIAGLRQLSHLFMNFGAFPALALLVISYLIGSVCSHLDVNAPDKESRWYVYTNNREGVERFAFGETNNDDKEDIEQDIFPYSKLHRYYKKRNIYLFSFIPWRLEQKKSMKLSKAFINILKARIKYYAPESMQEINKSEAHLRMMSALWHVSRITFVINLISFIACLVILIANLFSSLSIPTVEPSSPEPSFPINLNYYAIAVLAIISLSLAILSVWFRCSIKKFFYYQRLHEITTILENACLLDRDNNSPAKGNMFVEIL